MAPIFGAFLFLLYQQIPQTVTFKSWESKGPSGGEVYNEITYYKEGKKDIWIMRQSHNGIDREKKTWDKIALIVENKKVNFYQLKPGENNLNQFQKIPLKVDCLNCHANGPRLIRPAPDFSLSLFEQLKIIGWNYQIRSVGNITSFPDKKFKELYSSRLSFSIRKTQYYEWYTRRGLLEKQSAKGLSLSACVKCHSDQGPRGLLSKKQVNSIQFLVENKLMPPRHLLNSQELLEIKKFVAGF